MAEGVGVHTHIDGLKVSKERGSDGKESACSAGDSGSMPESRRSLEKGIATHSSLLAWRTMYTEAPGGLQSMGLQSWKSHFLRVSESHFLRGKWKKVLSISQF